MYSERDVCCRESPWDNTSRVGTTPLSAYHNMPETRKRPQRAAALKQTSYKVDEPLSEAEAGTSEAESVRSQLQRAKVRPPRKKAKLTATNAPAVSEGSTRRRKSLSKFLDMPLDVLYEVSSLKERGTALTLR